MDSENSLTCEDLENELQTSIDNTGRIAERLENIHALEQRILAQLTTKQPCEQIVNAMQALEAQLAELRDVLRVLGAKV